MKSVSVAFYDAKPYDIAYFTKANEHFHFTIDFFEPRLTTKTAILAAGHDVVCAFVNDKIDIETAALLLQHGVQLIALRCAGYNNIDLQAVWQKLHVVRVPSYSPYSVAEYAVALLMALTRKIPRSYNRTRDGNFRLDGLTGRDLHGRSIGIIGTGKIGKIMAQIMRSYGMNVLLHDAFPDTAWAKSINAGYVPLEMLFRNADVISLHCPLTPETHHIISSEVFSIIKPDAVLINTGRGALIDTPILVEALKNHRIGGAALDVYEEEDAYFYEDWSQDIIKDDVLARLLMMPNVIISSHQAFLTDDALSAIAGTTLQNIADYFEGKKLKNEICYQCQNTATCSKMHTNNCF